MQYTYINLFTHRKIEWIKVYLAIFFCLSFFCLLQPFSGSSSVTKQFTFNKYDYTRVSTYIHTYIHMHVSMVYININIHLTYLHTLLYLATRAKEHQCVFGPLLQTPYINIVTNIRTYALCVCACECVRACVTVWAKTQHVRIQTEIHFIAPAYSYTE